MSSGLTVNMGDDGAAFFSLECYCRPCVIRREKRLSFFPRSCSFCGEEQYCRKLTAPYEPAVYGCWPCLRKMEVCSASAENGK